jgi:hypothetical protein
MNTSSGHMALPNDGGSRLSDFSGQQGKKRLNILSCSFKPVIGVDEFHMLCSHELIS